MPNIPPPFSAPYAPDDADIAARLLPSAHLGPPQEARIDRTATRLIEAIRKRDDRLGGVEDMLREFSLSTKEGLALMVLAEALLRVPDARTADRLIEDKLGEGDFIHHEVKSTRLPGLRLGLGARPLGAGHPAGRDARRHHRPSRQAARRAGGAHRHAPGDAADGQSFRARRDHRGGAGAGASRAPARGRAIPSTCSAKARAPPPMPSAISTPMRARSKPSARPRATIPCPTGPASRSSSRRCIRASRRSAATRVMTELVPQLLDLAQRAKAHDLNFTVDAEEADRLELSLDVIAAALADPSLPAGTASGLRSRPIRSAPSAVIDYVESWRARMTAS